MGWNDRGVEKIGEKKIEEGVWLEGWESFFPGPQFKRKLFSQTREKKMLKEWVWWEIIHLHSPLFNVAPFLTSYSFSSFWLALNELDFIFIFCIFFLGLVFMFCFLLYLFIYNYYYYIFFFFISKETFYLYYYLRDYSYLGSSFFWFKKPSTPLCLSRDKTKGQFGKNTTISPTKTLLKK